MTKSLVSLALLLFWCVPSAAQHLKGEDHAGTCEGTVYQAAEVARRATFISLPTPPGLTEEARANLVSGRVLLKAVLCRTGRVTDIQVIESLPFGMTEQAVEAARRTSFTPAQKDGQAVSQAGTFEFRFSGLGERHPLAHGPLAGRMIECIEITGYREGLLDTIGARLKTRLGEPYNQKDIEQDWETLMEQGDFDKDASTLRIEEGERGGLNVVFQLRERRDH
jgi:TonB family protein